MPEIDLVRFGVEIGEPVPSARLNWRRRLRIDDNALVILSSRLLRPNYNIDSIIRALPAVRREIPGAIRRMGSRPLLGLYGEVRRI